MKYRYGDYYLQEKWEAESLDDGKRKVAAISESASAGGSVPTVHYEYEGPTKNNNQKSSCTITELKESHQAGTLSIACFLASQHHGIRG
jgi:hypothetical protein